ncbi:MAG: 3'-5' exonuclease [Candidatus Magasanikbacteria bacterium]|jgi:3'-5' exonuclease|nr:3'-5' exonuclease [Candidatus Magasanikbacteria bacterium]MBT4315039.1 3'-5' exonuclease [Candidatus Magasanikbacteria bacterium]MBT4546818.1 3'-5' exonuclease [Candidatus Magasanikbacteria bacterium]MBT6818983.1 3'-5' exonuclease [Candidatus Magasanikbacteria bacterium]
MKTIVFDIETIPVDFDTLDEAQKKYLLKFAENEEDEEKAKERMALWAPTNRIVAIGMLSVEGERGAVYFQAGENPSADAQDREDFEEGKIKYSCGSEKEILEKFWKAISYANRFVTFNGRGFDCPVLMLRSAMNNVKPTRNLMPYRYKTDFHVDLLEQMTFYSASRKFNLDFYCKAFGIESPKSSGVTGHDVKPLFESGEYEKIARYCAGDLWATRELYLRWRDYMQF